MEITVAKLLLKPAEDELGFSGTKLGKEVAVFMDALHTTKANGKIQHLYSTGIVVWMEAATELYQRLADDIDVDVNVDVDSLASRLATLATRIGRARLYLDPWDLGVENRIPYNGRYYYWVISRGSPESRK